MTQDDHVSFKAPIQPNTITYLSLDGGKTIILPRKGATADGQTAQVQYVIDGEVLQSVIPATASGTTAQLQYPTANDCGECSQLVEVNQNLVALNKTAGKIETCAWIAAVMLMILVLMKIIGEKKR